MAGIALLAVIALVVIGAVVLSNKPGAKSAEAKSSESSSSVMSSPSETPSATALPSASPMPSATATSTSTPSGTAAAASCAATATPVVASTDAPSYPAGKNPVFTLTVTNTGTTPCQLNVGTSQMEFLVFSGQNRVFSSKDCQDGAADLVKVLQPGVAEKANFTWQRNSTVPGCATAGPAPAVGPTANYTLSVKLGSVTSAGQAFTLAG